MATESVANLPQADETVLGLGPGTVAWTTRLDLLSSQKALPSSPSFSKTFSTASESPEPSDLSEEELLDEWLLELVDVPCGASEGVLARLIRWRCAARYRSVRVLFSSGVRDASPSSSAEEISA